MLDVSSENLLRSVFHTLAYADVFDYPLTAPEVYRYLTSNQATFEEVTRILSGSPLFSQIGEYYTLQGREQIVKTRKQRGEIAQRLWDKAARYGRIIAMLPFVRMVAVTGSLAMSNTDAGNDVDYFIVTAPKHLWTCRALSLLVARIAKLEGTRLCPNYLVTTDALELNDRSLYVAHELTQMIPLSGMKTYEEIFRRNPWIYGYLPNASGMPELPKRLKVIGKASFMQKVLEVVLNTPLGDWFEKWEMNRKTEKLTREQSSSFESHFSADVCKGHIDQHGETVGKALAVRLKKEADLQATS